MVKRILLKLLHKTFRIFFLINKFQGKQENLENLTINYFLIML